MKGSLSRVKGQTLPSTAKTKPISYCQLCPESVVSCRAAEENLASKYSGAGDFGPLTVGECSEVSPIFQVFDFFGFMRMRAWHLHSGFCEKI